MGAGLEILHVEVMGDARETAMMWAEVPAFYTLGSTVYDNAKDWYSANQELMAHKVLIDSFPEADNTTRRYVHGDMEADRLDLDYVEQTRYHTVGVVARKPLDA